MRVAFFSLLTFDIVGGLQTYNKKFLKALESNSIDYIVISFHDKQKCQNNNTICCNSNIFKFIYYIYKYRDFADISVWGHINLSPFLFLNKLFSKSKNILLTHGVEVWPTDLSLLKKLALKKGYDRVFTVSNFTKNSLITTHKVPKEKIGILQNSIILSHYRKDRKNPYNSQKFNILTILRLDESIKLKSVTNVLDAMLKIEDKDIHFTIIGKGNKEEYIKDEIKRRGLSNQVDMLGFVEDLSSYLEHCDIFSLISDREGFGIVYLEAMAYEKPCISAKNCGSSDVVIDGYNGYSVELDDINDLVDKISDLKLNKKRREEFGKSGYKLLVERFTFEKFIENQKELLKNCLIS